MEEVSFSLLNTVLMVLRPWLTFSRSAYVFDFFVSVFFSSFSMACFCSIAKRIALMS